MITGSTEQVLIDTFCRLKQEVLKAGLIVNTNKTKYFYCIRKANQPTHINTEGEQFEQVNSFKYLGTIVNTDNSTKEIKERTAAGNRAYDAHKTLFTSKLISINVKQQLYNTLIRPTVTYASETWVLKEKVINKLTTFERKTMRKIYVWPLENLGWLFED